MPRFAVGHFKFKIALNINIAIYNNAYLDVVLFVHKNYS